MKSLEQLQPPVLTDLLNTLKSTLSAEINCVQIGIIRSFDTANQTASIEFAIKKLVEIQVDGTRIYQDRPILLDCPVLVLFGGNSFLSMPIAEGDNCIILFNDREIDQWFINGGVQAPVTLRKHSLSDGFALVGIRSLQDSIADYLADGVRLSYNSTSRISLTEDLIESIAELFKQNGDMLITGNLTVNGNEEIKGNSTIDGNMHIKGGLQVDGLTTGSGGGTFGFGNNVTLNGHTLSGGVVSSTNGTSGTFVNSVTVVNGIVTAGT